MKFYSTPGPMPMIISSFITRATKYLMPRNFILPIAIAAGVISSIKVLSATPCYIFPGDYIVVTEDADNLAVNYLVKNPDNVLVLSSPPSFPDDEGDVVTLNFQGTVVDEVKYKDDWHFKLIDDEEGVSLERIDPDGTSQDAAQLAQRCFNRRIWNSYL